MRCANIRSFIVIVGALWSIPQIALGYPYPGVEDPSGDSATGIYSLGRNIERGQTQSPGNSFASSSPLEEIVNNPVGRGFNPNVWCPNGGNCGEFTGSDYLKPEPSARSTTINSLSPMAGFQSIVNSMAYSNQAANALVAPMTLMNVAMQLTEPGISAGLSIALNNVNQSLQSRFLANQAFIANASVSPEGVMALRAYQACMARKMGSTVVGERRSWPQADAECQGGEVITNGTTAPFSAVSPAGFNLVDDDSHSSRFQGVGVPEREPDQITLTDYLFNQEIDLFVPERMNSLRTSFLETVGDIFFSVSEGSIGTRRLTHTRLAPEISAEELHRRHTLVAYNVIHEILFSQCTQFTSPSALSSDFYDRSTTQELMARLAVAGHMTRRPVMQAFYREFTESLRRTNEECSVLQSWQSTSPTSIDSISQGGDWGRNTSRMSRVIFSYAELIGRAKTLNTYLATEQLLRSLTAGTFDSVIRTLAFDALYDVAGSRDIQREHDKVLVKLKEFAEALVSENQDLRRLR